MPNDHMPEFPVKVRSIALTPALREHAARSAHEVNRTYCAALGDLSHLPWDEAPAWAKESALKGVDGVVNGTRDPALSHASWLQEKIATGWKYGPVKDAEKKEHPCMMPFDRLPVAQAMKDTLFVSTVRGVLDEAGVELPRTA